MLRFSWELVIYGEYLSSAGYDWFSRKNVDQWQRLRLPSGLYTMGCYPMAKAKAKQNGKYENALTWCNVTLSDEDGLIIEQWDISDGELFAGIMELQITGHSFTAKAATDGDGFTAFAIGVSDNCDNLGKGLSAFASNPRDATKVLLHKHFGMCGGIWPSPDASKTRKFR